MEFNPNQKKAIQTIGTNIIVSAGAGSGKTAVLSERVLHLVQNEGYHLNEFLILTFTRLAAAEMRERIRKKLISINSPEAYEVDRCDITTFDAYSLSLVKKYHSRLRLSPKIELIDSGIISVIKRKYLEEIFTAHYLMRDLDFENLILKYCFKDDADIKNMVLKLQEKAELELDKKEFFDNFIARYTSDEFAQKVKQDLFSYINETIEEIINETNNLDLYHEYTLKLQDYLSSFNGDFETLTVQIVNSSLPNIRGMNLSNDDRKIDKALKLKWNNLKKFVSKYQTLEAIKKELEQFRNDLSIIVSLARELDEMQWEYKRSKMVYEFNDIAKFALDLVKNHEEVRNEIRDKLKMIMVDEYQDTSSLQDTFISFISNNNVYMVGDIKQSIYRFRNANSDIFQDKYERYSNLDGGQKIDLKANYRSRKEVIDDINTIFKEIMTLELGGADYLKDHIIESGNTDYDKAGETNDHHHITSLVYSGDLKAEERREIEARIIATDIKRKISEGYQVYDKDISALRTACYGDFCILMDRGSAFDLYEKIFTEYQIPLYVENDEDITNNALTKVLVNLLKVTSYIINKKSLDSDFKHSFFSILRSFIFSCNDQYLYYLSKENNIIISVELEKIKSIISRNIDIPINSLFKELLFELDVYPKLVLIGDVCINERYIDMFVSSLESMASLDYSLDDVIDYFEHISEYKLQIKLSASSPSLDAVKLMNIHKSKGLEFSIVYYSGLTTLFNEKDYNRTFGYSNQYGLLLPNNEHQGTLLHILNQREEGLKDLSEKIRLFYVALTRAKEKMIMVLPQSKGFVLLRKANSFYKIFAPFVERFENKEAIIEEINLSESNKDTISQLELKLKPMVYETTKISKSKSSSKELRLHSDNKALEFGTKLHRILEVIDFVDPDWSLADNQLIKKYIQSFLSSNLLKDVEKKNIYREYEFFDEENNRNGIIDLLLIDEDKAVIIDYKTKNIDDEQYDLQLSYYREYIKKVFNLPTECYLYSLIEQKYRKVD